VLIASLTISSSNSVSTPSFVEIDQALVLSQQQTAKKASKAGVPYAAQRDLTHIHVAVRVSAAGTWLSAPRDMGLTDTGRKLAIHTHDATGVVHLHRPNGIKQFTLAQLMAVWGVELSDLRVDRKTNLAKLRSEVELSDLRVDRKTNLAKLRSEVELTNSTLAGYPAKILVNGKRAATDYVLKDRDDVVIMVLGGSSLPSFDWKAIPLEDSQ